MVNIRIYGYSDTLLVIFSMRVFSQNSGTYCMVPSDWDLALRCICGPNFRSTSLENSPVFCLFVCLCGCIKPLKQVDLRLRIVTVPGVQEEVRKNGVETKKNRDKSSNCDVCVTCDDVRCLL